MIARVLCILITAALLLPPAKARACPVISRDKIISIAKSGVGCRYVWGGTCWNPSNKTWKGADCSGYVTVAWQIPAASATTSCLPHYYTTVSFKNSSTHWSSISRNSLIKADALVYNSGSSGHVVLYNSGNKWGNAQAYEAKGTAYGIVYGTRYVSSSYAARRRHRLCVSTPPKPKYPLMTISSSISTISGQSRDFCTSYKSKGIFDWKAGQSSYVYVYVKNSGTAAAGNVYIGLWAEQPYLKVTQWNIYTNWKSSSYVLNDTDGMQKISHYNPAKQFKLWLGGMSPGETKRIRLKVQALKYSVGAADHPDIRAWVWHVDNYYEKKDFWAKPNNVKSYQKQNGGNLHTYTQTDVLSAEICDSKDNDCDGQVDEGGVCPKPPKPKADSGVPKPSPPPPKADSKVSQPPSGKDGSAVPPPSAPDSGPQKPGQNLGVKPGRGVQAKNPDEDTFKSFEGGCSMSGGEGSVSGGMLLLLLALLSRRRRF